MNLSITLFLVISLAPVTGLHPSRDPAVRTEAAAKRQLIRFSMINMSGKAREVHIRGSVISLPVGKPVVLQGIVGERVTVLSSTESRFLREFVLSAEDGGRVLPVA